MYSSLKRFFILSENRRWRHGLGLALCAACLAPLQPLHAVDPPPDGGYPIGNTAEGEDALFNLTSGFDNVAVGYEALYNNTSGILNTGTGYRALYSNTVGTRNTATGNAALSRTTTGSSNTATGLHAMFLNTTGLRNTGEGAFALTANTTGSYNIALGYNAGSLLTTGSNNIDIGNVGVAGEIGTLRIGTAGTQNVAYVAGIYGATVASGINVIIGPDGHLGTMTSSSRFKKGIKPMDKESEAILALKPVAFRYKPELDPTGIPQFGLVAEEVEKVDPELVIHDEQGKPFTVRYEAVNAMLLNEFLKEHGQMQQLKTIVAQQQKQIETQRASMAKQQQQIEELIAGLQKVTARFEMAKCAAYVVSGQ